MVRLSLIEQGARDSTSDWRYSGIIQACAPPKSKKGLVSQTVYLADNNPMYHGIFLSGWRSGTNVILGERDLGEIESLSFELKKSLEERLRNFTANAESYGLGCDVKELAGVPRAYEIRFTLENTELAEFAVNYARKALCADATRNPPEIIRACIGPCGRVKSDRALDAIDANFGSKCRRTRYKPASPK